MTTTNMFRIASLGLCLALAASTGMGCKSKKEPAVIDTGMTDTTPSYNEGGLPDIDPTKLNFTKSTDLETVYFDYDSANLRSDAMATLARNAERMKAKPAGTYFQVQGNCDERGTQEYNLALGERRALAVRSHLINLGVNSQYIVTVSFGEENPVAMGSSESAWSQNRRAEFGEAVMMQ